MLNALKEKIKVAVYPKLTANKFKEVDIFDIYESIRTSYKEETLAIQEEFSDYILSGFPNGNGKPQYQKRKRQLLQSAVFSGCYDRSISAKNTAPHSGRINLDIDENTKEELEAFLKIIKEGKISFIEAAALSVSGKLSGDFWINIKADIPSKLSAVPSELVKILNLTKDNFKAELHTAFYEMFADMLNEHGIKAGITKDLKRARYLTHDSGIYINHQATRLTLNNLIAHLNSKKQNKTEISESDADDIIQSDAFLFAEEYASKEYQLADHQKHLYITRLSICLNLLGIPRAETESYIQRKGVNVGSNCISYPYQAYKDSFGQWKYRLKIDIPNDYSLTLSSGEKLSDIKEELFHIYKTESAVSDVVKIDLSSGTGSGKSYFASKELGQYLKQLNGCKTVIVFPLNSKTEKDSIQYNLPFVTGEYLQKSKSQTDIWKKVFKSDVILTNINTFEKLAERLNSGGFKQLNIILDESHTFPNGMTIGYKPAEIFKMWESCKRYGKTVTVMSGTQKPYFNLLGFKKVSIKQESRPKIKLQVHTINPKESELTIIEFIKNFKISKGQKLLLKIQSKNKIERIYKLLLIAGFSKKEIVKLYSCPKIKKTKDYKRLITAEAGSESFNDDVKIILCTSFINEGLDIYSKSEIIAVSVLKNNYIDTDDEIQFFDRWRTDKEKQAYILAPEEKESDKKKVSKDYHLHVFKDSILAAQKAADYYNAAPKEKTPYTPIFSVKTQFSSYENTLVYSDADDKIIVNEIQLMHESEKIRKSSTGIKEALDEIASRFEYFDIIDDVSKVYNDAEGQLITDLENIKSAEAEERSKIQQSIQVMLNEDKEAFIQAVSVCSDDVGIKKIAAARAKDREVTVLNTIANNTEVFEEVTQAEKLVKRVFRLENMFLDDDSIKRILFNDKGEFISNSAYNILNEKYKILLHLYLFENSPNSLTKLQTADVKRLYKAKNILIDVIATQGEKISSESIYKALRPIFKRSLTQRKAVRLANILFNTDRSNGDWLLKTECTFFDFIREELLSNPQGIEQCILNFITSNSPHND